MSKISISFQNILFYENNRLKFYSGSIHVQGNQYVWYLKKIETYQILSRLKKNQSQLWKTSNPLRLK